MEYGLVFAETLLSKTLVPLSSDSRFFAMLYFGGYAMPIAALCAIVGTTISSGVNYLLGRLLAWHYQDGAATVLKPAKYTLWQRRLSLAAPIIGLAAWFHVIGALILAAGFLRVSALKMMVFILLGHTAYYGFHLLRAS